jgi:hypothetical protein
MSNTEFHVALFKKKHSEAQQYLYVVSFQNDVWQLYPPFKMATLTKNRNFFICLFLLYYKSKWAQILYRSYMTMSTAYNSKKCNLRLGNVCFLLSDREFHMTLFVKGSTDARQCLLLFFNTMALAKKDILRLDNIYFCCLIVWSQNDFF